MTKQITLEEEERNEEDRKNCFAVREVFDGSLAESKPVFINVYVYDSNSINRCVSLKCGAAGVFSVTMVGKFKFDRRCVVDEEASKKGRVVSD